ncbi:MAG TPA: ribose-5-phosphate isomerase RpiA [Gemmatimonadaceae bacterium]|nr:ribose-5-phosphate isomerase RpiA [Gemmatimonadaceae bacterium]
MSANGMTGSDKRAEGAQHSVSAAHHATSGGDAAQRAKADAAQRAAALVQSGMRLGLGTGSTASLVVERLGARLAAGELRDIAGVPTSSATRELAEKCGVPVGTLEEYPVLDLAIDGADEVDPAGDLIKGAGGALLWEKIVASSAARLVIVVDEGKLVPRLGVRYPVPVEVVPFGWRTHVEPLRKLGGESVLRRTANGEPYRTDSGHFILDVRFADGIADARALEQAVRSRPGVVETGLFLGFHPEVIVGRAG